MCQIYKTFYFLCVLKKAKAYTELFLSQREQIKFKSKQINRHIKR